MDAWDFRVKISVIQLLCEVITFSLQSQRTQGPCVRFSVCIMASGQGWIIEVFDYGRKRLAWPGMEGRGGRGVVVDGLCSREGEMYSSRRSLATSGIENEKLAGNVCMNAAGQLARGERKRREAARRISWYPRSERGTHARTHLLLFLSRSSFMWFKCYCINNVLDCDVKREMLWWLAGCVSSLNYKPLNVKFTVMGHLWLFPYHIISQ